METKFRPHCQTPVISCLVLVSFETSPRSSLKALLSGQKDLRSVTCFDLVKILVKLPHMWRVAGNQF